jgi:AraC-like DNA-binding protein
VGNLKGVQTMPHIVDPSAAPSAPAFIAPFLSMSDGFGLALEQRHTTEDIVTPIMGQDLLKMHVQVSGQRIMNFERRHDVDLHGATTAVLMHDAGVCKVERLPADRHQQSITIAVDRRRMWQILDEESTVVSPALQSLVLRRRSQPRLALATPVPAELAAAEALIQCRRAGPLRRLYVEAKAMELFCLILDRYQGQTPGASTPFRITARDRRQLAQVRDLLSERFVDPPSIHALSRQFGLNRNKLCGGFQGLYGVSVYDFCRNLRLEKGRQLLLHSESSIAQIAVAVGFASASAFSVSFHRQFGHAPSHYRRS